MTDLKIKGKVKHIVYSRSQDVKEYYNENGNLINEEIYQDSQLLERNVYNYDKRQKKTEHEHYGANGIKQSIEVYIYDRSGNKIKDSLYTVSYTHLTLPTKRIV